MLCHALHVYKNKIEKKKRINFDVEENTRQMDWIQSKEEEKIYRRLISMNMCVFSCYGWGVMYFSWMWSKYRILSR